MPAGRVGDRGLQVPSRAPLAQVVVMAALVLAPLSHSWGEGFIAEEIIIDTEGLQPQVLLIGADRRVTFVNRSGKMVHVDFIIRETELHHTVQVTDRIWAVFHRSGRHPYVVHFQDPTAPDLRGVIEVVSDPYGGPDARICSGVTVMGACIER